MSRSNTEIIADIDAFAPVNDDWLQLDALLEELWSDGSPADAIEPLLNVFERFPAHDGNGVFWTIIHGLEDVGGYENALLDSIRRRPSYCGLIMVNRLINDRGNVINGMSLIDLMKTVGNDDSIEPTLREMATRFFQYQRDKANTQEHHP